MLTNQMLADNMLHLFTEAKKSSVWKEEGKGTDGKEAKQREGKRESRGQRTEGKEKRMTDEAVECRKRGMRVTIQNQQWTTKQ